MTTATALTTANPDGTLTLTQSAVPSRVFQHGAWANLDPTLRANADGTLSPVATTDAVVLSGGGTGPAAQMYTGGQGFTLTLPVALPHPTLSGASAHYADVLTGVDLTVTVLSDGAVSDVFTLRNRAAAHDPGLPALLDATATTTRGLHLATDRTGDLAVTDTHGRPLYTAPAPQAWDSTTTPLTTGTAARTRSAALTPPAPSTTAPAHGAHTATLTATTRTNAIDLALPTALLNAPTTGYPVYLDPTYSPTWGNDGWSSPGSGVASENYWNSTVDSVDTPLRSEVGNSGSVQAEAMSLFNYPIPYSALHGAKIYGASFGITETYSWACPTSGHDQTVDLYAPSQVLSSGNANWNAWSGSLGSAVAANSFARGYNSSCPAGAAPAFSSSALTTDITNDIANNVHTQTLALRADDHSDNYAFKKFDPTSAILTITYDKYPNTPTALKTVPSTNCDGSALGDTGVTIYATQSTPTNSSLTTTFNLYKSSDGTKSNLLTSANGVASDTWTGGSGQQAVLTLPESFFSKQANGAKTSFSFVAESTDTTLSSGWNTTACTFNWDPTRPGTPTVGTNPTPPAGAQSCLTLDGRTGSTEPIGSTCGFTLTPPTTGGTSTSISGYSYQVNQAPPVTVSATGSTGITVPLTRLVNTLTVSALSPGGNIGSATTVWFDGTKLSPPAVDGDLTLDGTPDLIVPGGTTGAFPPGLWLANGSSNGNVSANPVNIGLTGLGANSNGTPADWNGSQPITSAFCGNGAQDVLAYFPTGANAGGGDVACDDGSSGPLHGTGLNSDSAPYIISAGSLVDNNGNNVTQVAAAGNTSANNTGLPDLLATGTDGNLYLFNSTTPNGYDNPFGECTSTCDVLSTLASPDGMIDWNTWTIATAQLAGGTSMYMWQPSTGALDLWTGLAVNSTGTALTTTGQYAIATNWNTKPADSLQLRAADFSGAGIPDLWTTDIKTGTTTALMPSTLANYPTPVPSISTSTADAHTWPLDDIGSATSGSTVTTTADTAGNPALPLTSAGSGVTWDSSNPNLPADIDLDGSSTSTLTSTQAVNVGSSFSASLWVNTAAASGVALAQGGSFASGFVLYPGPSGWEFCMANKDSTGYAYNCAYGGTVALSAWTHVTITYNATTQAMALYIDGQPLGTATHAPASGFTGKFMVGEELYQGAYYPGFSGSLSDIELWNQALTPAQVATQGGIAGYVPPASGQWKLNNSTGTVAADSSAGNHPATIGGGATWASDPTYPGQSLSLNGSTGYAATAGPVVDSSKSITASVWVKLNANSANSVFLSQSDTTGATFGYELYYSVGANAWAFGKCNTDAANTGISALYGPSSGVDSASLGTWTMVTGVFNAGTNLMQLYVDGTLVSSGTYAGTAWNAAGNFQIGRLINSGGYGQYAAANLSQVNVWNSALTPDQVNSLYQQGS